MAHYINSILNPFAWTPQGRKASLEALVM